MLTVIARSHLRWSIRLLRLASIIPIAGLEFVMFCP